MYFKQRSSSPLYQHYQKQENLRLSKKIHQIQTRKQTPYRQNCFPPITHRPSHVRVYQKKLQTIETDRLNKRLDYLKNNRSQYFTKVLGLNLSLDLTKISKPGPLESAHPHTVPRADPTHQDTPFDKTK